MELSPGCKYCQEGTWLCLFMGMRCNCDCWFCSRPLRNDAEEESPDTYLGMTFEELAQAAVDQEMKGVAYSGGEPLMYLKKVIGIAREMKKALPSMYQWIYTNGLLLDYPTIDMLRLAGIREIRVNPAATNFNADVIDKLRWVDERGLKITVEMPAIPEVKEWLLDKKGIYKILGQGVEQLNLAELYIKRQETLDYLKGHDFYESPIGLTPVWSKDITIEVMNFVLQHNIPILVNSCSTSKKLIQINNRKHSPDLMALDKFQKKPKPP